MRIKVLSLAGSVGLKRRANRNRIWFRVIKRVERRLVRAVILGLQRIEVALG